MTTLDMTWPDPVLVPVPTPIDPAARATVAELREAFEWLRTQALAGNENAARIMYRLERLEREIWP